MKKEIESLILAFEKDLLTEKEITRVNELFFSYPTSLKEEVEMIVVLSSGAIKRMEKVIELYKKRSVPILISGSCVVEKDQLLEDERYFIYAVSHGVDPKDIYFENKSTNTEENFRYTLPIIKGMKITSFALVTSSQHMMRSLLTAKKVMKMEKIEGLRLSPVACYATAVPRENWWNSAVARNIIKGELERLLRYQLISK